MEFVKQLLVDVSIVCWCLNKNLRHI